MELLLALATEPEIMHLIVELAEWRHLAGYFQSHNSAQSFDALQPDQFRSQLRAAPNIFLAPGDYVPEVELSLRQAKPKLAGWITICMGAVVTTASGLVVTLTQISARQSEDGTVRGDLFVAGLRKRLKKRWHFGVVVPPGARQLEPVYYMDICYSDEALLLYKQGAHWQQGVGSPFSFCPIESPQSE